MKDMNMDFGILTETKLTTDFYAREADGYTVTATTADSIHQGGVALFHRESEFFVMEGTKAFGPNVIRATLVAGDKKWTVIGAYIPSSETDGSTLALLAKAWRTAPTSHEVILLGDLNVDLYMETFRADQERQWNTIDVVGKMGLTDLFYCFRQKKRSRGEHNEWTWSAVRNAVKLKSRLDYILTSAKNDFRACRIRTPRFDTDHRMILGVLKVGARRTHCRYMSRRMTFPKSLKPKDPSEVDEIFETLVSLVEKKQPIDSRKKSWISDATWQLIDGKSEARRVGNMDSMQELKKQIKKSLRKDRQARVNSTAAIAGAFLEGKAINKAYESIRGWYKSAGGKPPKPTVREARTTREEYQKLYTDEKPIGEPLRIHVTPANISDEEPTEGEIVEALKKLKLGKAAGASTIKVEDLRLWYKNAREPENGAEPTDEAIEIWEKVLKLISTAFTTGDMPSALCNGVLVLIPKDAPGEFRGIALLETIYKLISCIINTRLKHNIKFHDAIHGFRAERGTGTALIEAKLKMQLTMRGIHPLFMIFLDLKKAYDTLDREEAIRILRGYGVGPNIIRIIENIWAGDTMVTKQSGYYGEPFRAKRGVRQGDILSPMIFNIMVDAVLRAWDFSMPGARGALFYADDGLLYGDNGPELQRNLDFISASFASVGLTMNAKKTEAMIMAGSHTNLHYSDEAYERSITGEGLTFRQKAREKVTCKLCGTQVGRGALKLHQTRSLCKKAQKDYVAMEPEEIDSEPELLDELFAEPESLEISMPCKGMIKSCPKVGCIYSSDDRRNMRSHFAARHLGDTLTITEDGPFPQCEFCGLSGKRILNPKHRTTEKCKKLARHLEKRFTMKKQEVAKRFEFTVNGKKIKTVSKFKYLGRMVTNNDSDDATIMRNLKRARMKWGRLSRLLTVEGANPMAMGIFYKVIVQTVLLYGSESWVISKAQMRALRSFHQRCARYITRRHIRQKADGSWVYPPSQEVLAEAGLLPIEDYIQKRKDTVAEFARGRPLLIECMASRQVAGPDGHLVWWSQVHSDLSDPHGEDEIVT